MGDEVWDGCEFPDADGAILEEVSVDVVEVDGGATNLDAD